MAPPLVQYVQVVTLTNLSVGSIILRGEPGEFKAFIVYYQELYG